VSPIFGTSQTTDVDSLVSLLRYAKQDTSKVGVLISLGKVFRYSNVDTAVHFAKEALALSSRLNYEMGIADAKRGLCALHASLGKFDEGVKYGHEALSIYNRLLSSAEVQDKDKILAKIGSTYMVIGHNRVSQGNYAEGLKSSLQALKIKEDLRDKMGIAGLEYNIGNIYYNQHNYSEAMKHHNASLKINLELGTKGEIADDYNTIGLIFFAEGNYTNALRNYSIALKLAQEARNKYALAQIYDNLGVINERLGNFHEALNYDFASLDLVGEIGIDEGVPSIHNNIAMAYMRQKKYNHASIHLYKALALAKRSGSLENMKLSYQNWARLDSAQGNYRRSLKHYKTFIFYRDSLYNEEITKKIVQLQMQHVFDKKEDSLIQKHVITETKLQVQKRQRYFYWGGICMLVVLSIFVFLNFRNQKKVNRLAAGAHTRQKADMELQHLNGVMKERLRISRELHDEVGATLSGISMYSHLAKEQIKYSSNLAIEKSLTIMQHSSGEMVNKLNDIVWLIKPEQDSLKKLVERLEEYAHNMAAIKNMHVEISLPENLHEHTLPMETRRNIYMFCKEAINNAVKYSQGSLLKLGMKEVEGNLEVSIGDNGKGFDAAIVRRGNGLENMQKRADEIGATLVLTSKENEGVSISIKCKITG